MIVINEDAQQILNELIEQYVDYRAAGEYGISSFWYWYYQVRNYIYQLDKYDTPIGDGLIYSMPYWGKVFFSRHIIGAVIYVVVSGFKFNKMNFQKWIKHENLPRKTCYKIGDGGYNFTLMQNEKTGLKAIRNPHGKFICKAVFDDIIGFHHSTDDYNVIHAIGFIGERVYSISMNGNVTLLNISKEEYLKRTHRYDEIINRRISRIIIEIINQYLKQNLILN